MVLRSLNEYQTRGLQKALEKVRDSIFASDMGYQMLGKEIVLPTACILEICKRAKYVKV